MDADRFWQTALIVEDAAERRWLEFPDVSRCRRCREGSGCGAAQWARLFGLRAATRWPLPNDCRLEPGTPVRAGLRTGVVLGLAVRAYLLPLLVFVALLIVTDRMGLAEALSLPIGLAGALIALWWARVAAAHRINPKIEPIDPGCGALESLGG